MPPPSDDDDRARRRMGDATRSRIAELASGWDVASPVPPVDVGPTVPPGDVVPVEPTRGEPVAVATAIAPPGPAARSKGRTQPPPPPGSAARSGAVTLSPPPAPAPAPRTKPPTPPPPAKPATIKSGPTETGTVAAIGSIGPPTGVTGALPAAATAPTAVPVATAESPPTSGSTRLPRMPAGARPLGPSRPPPVRAATPVALLADAGFIEATGAERPDATDVSAPPSAVPPPMPTAASAPARLPRMETMEADLLEDDPSVDEPAPLFPTLTAKARPTPAPAGPAPTAVHDVGSASTLAVPVGEFGGGLTTVDPDGLRMAHEQSTFKRDAAGAILGMAEHLTAVVAAPAPPPSAVAAPPPPETERSTPAPIERGDPTLLPDSTEVGGASMRVSHAGTLRESAALRRKRGIAGDVRYVATALFGVRRASRELEVQEGRQTSLQISRRRHLTTLGRTAVTAESLDHDALAKAREELSEIEDERAQHTAQVQAADSELMRVRTDRTAAAAAHAAATARLDAELADIAKKLEPLEKDVTAIGKRAAELRTSLARIKHQIVDAESSLVSVKGQKVDRAAVTAEIATLKADREAVQRDEPVIASELDALNPRIAALEARRSDLKRKRAELDLDEQQDRKRTAELLTAIGAKRVVVDRAAADAEALRDRILLQLGEQLYVDRPDDLRNELAPVDTIDVELATTDRRIMELREILGSVDRWKLLRGIFVILVTLGAITVFAYWVAVNV